jgi:hypothetical protein
MARPKIATLFAAVLAASALLTAAPAVAQTNVTSAAGVEVVSVTPNGSGCPVGTANAALLGSNQFQVTYDNFSVDLEQGTTSGTREKFCQLLIALKLPAKYQITVTQATYRGFLTVGAGTTANLWTSYYFASDPGTATQSFPLASAPNPGADWTRTSTAANLTWSSCGATVYFNAKGRLTLSSPGRHGFSHLTMDTTNSTVYSYALRPCA